MSKKYRHLTSSEVEQLERQGNMADSWKCVSVAEEFCVEAVRHNVFMGEVKLGTIGFDTVQTGEVLLREGVSHSVLHNVTIGDHAAIHNVKMLSGYRVGNHVVLFNINEMTCTSDPDKLAWMEPMNENGGRRIMPFGGMTIGDAYMWARYRGRKRFVERLEQFTRDLLEGEKNRRGSVGDRCTVKNCNVVRNVELLSSADDPTVVDGSMALCDGVVGYGCKVEHGVMAERFLLGEHVHLEMGLRLNDTVVGDNSTLARCEVGNSIIFPAHEQHHNNSFLIAGLIMGQSNIAAGGTIGSNHNSRTADNELTAGRGFWPGLCCSFKHSSRFASYCLLAKADYPSELDIKLPFALVNNNAGKNQLEVMPAYWWLYNMYAMDRNSKKFAKRDKRVVKAQHIEFDNLAPDTAEEILHGMHLLEGWIETAAGGEVVATGMEKSKRRTVVLKANEGMKAYEEMLLFYAMRRLTEAYGRQLPPASLGKGVRESEWVNIGGQLVAKQDMEQLIADVEGGAIAGWEGVNARLDSLWTAYPEQCLRHAYHILCTLLSADTLDENRWQACLGRFAEVQAYVEEQKVSSRRKDDENPFRNMTYWDDEERQAVLGN